MRRRHGLGRPQAEECGDCGRFRHGSGPSAAGIRRLPRLVHVCACRVPCAALLAACRQRRNCRSEKATRRLCGRCCRLPQLPAKSCNRCRYATQSLIVTHLILKPQHDRRANKTARGTKAHTNARPTRSARPSPVSALCVCAPARRRGGRPETRRRGERQLRPRVQLLNGFAERLCCKPSFAIPHPNHEMSPLASSATHVHPLPHSATCTCTCTVWTHH